MTFLLSGGALPLAALGLGAAMLVCVRTARSRSPWLRALAIALWLAALAGVIYLTLFLTNPNGGGINLRPFASISLDLHRENLSMAAFNLLGNLLLLAPFGLLAKPAFRWGWLTTALAAATLSTSIEFVQGLTGRSADIDDILLNTAGATCAALVSSTLFWAVRRASVKRAKPAAVNAAVNPAPSISAQP